MAGSTSISLLQAVILVIVVAFRESVMQVIACSRQGYIRIHSLNARLCQIIGCSAHPNSTCERLKSFVTGALHGSDG